MILSNADIKRFVTTDRGQELLQNIDLLEKQVENEDLGRRKVGKILANLPITVLANKFAWKRCFENFCVVKALI